MNSPLSSAARRADRDRAWRPDCSLRSPRRSSWTRCGRSAPASASRRRRTTARPATNYTAARLLALRAAKRAGPGTVRRFVPQIQEEHSERRFFLRELEAAIQNKIARGPLPAGGRGRRRRHHRRRGAAALDPSDARRYFAVAVHSAGRGKRLDDRLGEIGIAARACRRHALAGSVSLGQSVAGADAKPRPCRLLRTCSPKPAWRRSALSLK